MNEYDAISQRIETSESDIRCLRSSMTDIKENLAKNNVLTEQCVRSNEKLSETMDIFKDTMCEITSSLKDSNRVTSDLAKKMESFETKLNDTNDKMDEKFNELRGEVELVDGKSKVDVLEWLKTNWIKLAILLGGGSLAVDKLHNLF